MPLASSNDLILAGLQDNLHALHHPLSGSPWHHTRTVTMMPCLTALVSILTCLLATPSRPSPPAPDTTNGHITSPDPPLIVAMPLPDPPLRVTLHVQHPPAHPLDTPKAVTFGATFDISTGSIGTRRRRTRRKCTPPKALKSA